MVAHACALLNQLPWPPAHDGRRATRTPGQGGRGRCVQRPDEAWRHVPVSGDEAPSPTAELNFPARLLSDLHLGHEVSTIRRSTELEPLLEDGIRTLILNGDTLESRLPRFFERSRQMLAELREMCQRRGIELVLLNGNHDPSLWPHDWLRLAGGQVFITHGHVFLRFVSPWSSRLRHCRGALEEIEAEYDQTSLRGMEARYELTRRWSERMIATEVRQSGQGMAAKLKMALHELWPPSRPWNVAKVWTMLPAIATRFIEQYQPQAGLVLFGHTHRAAWWRRNGRLLVNTGGFVSFAKPLAVDFLSESQAVIRRVPRRKDHWLAGRTLARFDAAD